MNSDEQNERADVVGESQKSEGTSQEKQGCQVLLILFAAVSVVILTFWGVASLFSLDCKDQFAEATQH